MIEHMCNSHLSD